MKKRRLRVGLFFLVLLNAGCVSSMTPSEKTSLEKEGNRNVYCQKSADCAEKWSKVESWMKANSPYMIVKKSDSLIKTAGPTGLNDSLAFTATKSAITFFPESPIQGIQPEASAAGQADANGAYAIVLHIRCNNWFGCARPRLEAQANFVNFVMGSPTTAKPVLGAKTTPVTPEMAKKMGTPDIQGVLVTQVTPSSLADKADLHEGDIVVKYDGAALTADSVLQDLVTKTPPGEYVGLVVIRNNALKTLIVIT